jgi:hypothetical protein
MDEKDTAKSDKDAGRGRPATVANLASFAEHASCPTAGLGFATGVDFDRLVGGTDFASPFGQTPYAFARGRRFEAYVKEAGKDGICKYGPLLELLRDELGYNVKDARTVNLRREYSRDKSGLVQRAQRTRELLAQIARGDKDAPNFIDGAVLTATVAGRTAHYETDGIAFRLGEQLRIIEIKSFPVVDGQADPQAVGSALDQGALYVLLVRRTLADQGIADDLISDELVLICPVNVGLKPGLNLRTVAARIKRMKMLLDAAPSWDEVDPKDAAEAENFKHVMPEAGSEKERIGALAAICDKVGTEFSDACQGCGIYRFCRERAFTADAVSIGGHMLERELAGITSLRRAAELADGEAAAAEEEAAAEQLRRLRTLQDQATRRGAA